MSDMPSVIYIEKNEATWASYFMSTIPDDAATKYISEARHMQELEGMLKKQREACARIFSQRIGNYDADEIDESDLYDLILSA